MEIKWRVNDRSGSQNFIPGKNILTVPVAKGEVFTRVEAEILIPPSPKMFFNGYQSWTHCPEYKASDLIHGLERMPKLLFKILALDHFSDYHFVDYPYKKGHFHGFSYCYFLHKRPLLHILFFHDSIISKRSIQRQIYYGKIHKNIQCNS